MLHNLRLFALASLLLLPALASAQAPTVGAVFAMTNSATANEILAWDRDMQGMLTPTGTFATNGTGTGAPLGSQGALALSEDGTHLVAVNAGSNEITLFGVTGSTLTLQDKVSSNGLKPVSVTIHEDIVYVLNAGNPNSIDGFTITAQDTLVLIANSSQPLSAATANPGQILFSADGQKLAVTEKATDLLDWFPVDVSTNVPLSFQSQPTTTLQPFGLVFRNANQLYVAEKNNSQVDMGAVSHYALRTATYIQKGSVDTTETGTSGIAMTKNKKYIYVSNPDNDTITGFKFGPNGVLQLLDPSGVSATAGDEPVDMAALRQHLYALNIGDGTISVWSIDSATGALTSVQPALGGLPTSGAGGLVAR